MRRHHRGTFATWVLALVFAAVLLQACGGSRGADSGATQSFDDEDFDNPSSFGQGTLPAETGDPNNGPGNTPSSALPPSTKTEQSSFPDYPESDPGDDYEPLELPPGYSYAALIRDWLGYGPFDPSRLPDPSFLNTLFCFVVDRVGFGIADKYDFVQAVHLDVLGRLPATDEAARLVTSLPNLYDQSQRHAVASTVVHSKEKRQKMVTLFFYTFLRRAPRADELAQWVKKLETGSSWEDVMSGIISGEEYFRRVVGRAIDVTVQTRRLVQAFHRDLLGRKPKAWELKRWQNVLLTRGFGAARRAVVAGKFINSAEARLKFIEFTTVLYLGRQATPAERKAWLDKMVAGKHRLLVVKDFLTLDEYLRKQDGRFAKWTKESVCRN